jgi:hypothetical protein
MDIGLCELISCISLQLWIQRCFLHLWLYRSLRIEKDTIISTSLHMINKAHGMYLFSSVSLRFYLPGFLISCQKRCCGPHVLGDLL